MQLAFGRNRGIPEDVTTAWGARLIAPDDLLHDRQDLVAEDATAKADLVAWLDGTPSGSGAIAKMREWLRENYWRFRQDDEQLTIHEDHEGIIVGSTQGSHGYVYVCGWLKPLDKAALREIRRSTPVGRAHDGLTVEKYKVRRMPITTERWHTHYGWSEAEAAKFGENPNSTEVRIFALHTDGSQREIEGEPAGSFEFGYGGSGPHATAHAIVGDQAYADDLSPANLQELVPEVFAPTGRESMTITVIAADVRTRIEAAC